MAAPRRTGAWALVAGARALGARGIALLAALHAGSAYAEVGTGRLALPAADRVLVPVTDAAPLAAAATAGYGLTESQAMEGAHHRVLGSVSAALGIGHNLAASLAIDGRYDRHPGGDSNAVGTPQLGVVGGIDLGSGLSAGASLSLLIPGENAPSLRFDSPALTAQALLAWTHARGFTAAGMAGFRLDETRHAGPDASRLSAADRLSLGLSQFNALPCGVALFQALGRHELLAEFSAEWLLGKGAPDAAHSPMRAALGGRLGFAAGFSGELLLELGLSRRPAYTVFETLIPVEPRFAVMLGLRYVPVASKPEPPPPPAPVAAPQTTRLSGFVFDPDGARLSDIHVAIRVGDVELSVVSGVDGEYSFQELPRGHAHIVLDGPGVVATSQELELTQPDMLLPLQAARAEPSAQLRGLVRSFTGAALPAVIRVLGVGQTVTADKDGRFMLELHAGDYEVEIECAGYLTQRRKISVQDNGVTLLNVELHEAPR